MTRSGKLLWRASAAFITAFLCSGTAHAQVNGPSSQDATTAIEMDAMVTDRPDFTESSDVIGRGVFQFESGLSINGEGSARGLTVPSALMRIGVAPRLELRLGADGFLSQTDGLIRQSGYSDFELGVKIRVLDQAAAGFDMALIPMASLPTGADAFTSGGVDPTLKITFARTAPYGFGLTGNVNFSSLSDDQGRLGQRALSLSLGHDLMGGWGGFIEAFGFSPMARGDGSGVTIDGGVSRPLGNTAQFDVEVGRGVTQAADDWFVGVGFAVRGRMPRSR